MAEPEDHQRFAEIVQMSKTGAFSDFRIMITSWVSEAYDKMVEAEFASDELLACLTRRYQHRLKLKREIDHWVSSAEKGLEEITESMRQDLDRMSHPQDQWLQGVEYQ